MPHAPSPLDPSLAQIRLLDIDPGSAQLTCRRRVASLYNKPSFAALSYVWGDPADLVAISIDSEQAYITRTLYDALVWCRSWRSGLSLWADAICINQNDVDEKNSQVRLMVRIYREASHVVCWLGPSSPAIETYLEERRYFGNQLNKHGKFRLARRWSAVRYAIRARALLSREFKEEQTLRLYQAARGEIEFLQLPYFQRMWTFQEALLPSAAKVVYVLGNLIRTHNPQVPTYLCIPSYAWEVAARINPTCSHISQTEAQILQEATSPVAINGMAYLESTDLCRRVVAAGRKSDAPGDCFQLWRLLVATSYRQCTDPRDKIYAVLGLLYPIEEAPSHLKSEAGQQRRATTEPASELPPQLSLAQARQRYLAIDYDKIPEFVSLDALYYVYHYERKVRRMLIANVLQAYRPIGPQHPLSAVKVQVPSSSSSGSETKLPSWLPDVSRPRLFRGRRVPIRIDSGPDRVNWAESKCFGRLRHMLSFSAQSLGTVIMSHWFPPTWEGAAKTIIAFLKQAAVKWTPTGDSVPEFAKAIESRVNGSLYSILGHPYWHRADYVVSPSHEEAGSEHLSSVASTQQQGGNDSSELAAMTVQSKDQIANALHGLVVFLLDTGRFGICADTVRPGDRVVGSIAWHGCLVVRRVVDDTDGSSSTAYHQLVEYTYVDDASIKYGFNLWDKNQLRKMQDEEIKLI